MEGDPYRERSSRRVHLCGDNYWTPGKMKQWQWRREAVSLREISGRGGLAEQMEGGGDRD